MEELYIEMRDGNVPIDSRLVEKYNLQKGMKTPFSRHRIVGKNGEYFIDPLKQEGVRNQGGEKVPFDGFPDDGIETMDNGFELSTSEIIDFAQGVKQICKKCLTLFTTGCIWCQTPNTRQAPNTMDFLLII
jgi:hypothetical protein